jgi:hypothetical protein
MGSWPGLKVIAQHHGIAGRRRTEEKEGESKYKEALMTSAICPSESCYPSSSSI